MNYYGLFADINDRQYRVEFKKNQSVQFNPSASNFSSNWTQVILGETPCMIQAETGKIFDPMKMNTCTIQVVTKEYLPDLYSPTPHGVEVIVTNLYTETIEFHGWVTPCMYDQGYTYVDTVDVEAIDGMSSLQYYDYTCQTSGQAKNVSIIDILKRAFTLAGYSGAMCWIEGYENKSISDICVSESNFFDDDDLETPWKWYDVVEEICKFLGWSCMPYGDDVYFVDYRYLTNKTEAAGTLRPWTYKYWTSGSSYDSSTPAYGYNTVWDSINLIKAPGSPQLSLDEVYNKITVTANTYDIKGIHQLDDNSYYKSINKEQGIMNVNIPTNVYTSKYGGFLGGWRKTSVGGYPSYAGAYSRITEESGWEHSWYSFSPLANMTNPSSPISWTNYFGQYPYKRSFVSGDYTNGINGTINTVGAAFCKYVVGNDYSSASSCIMFLKLYDENTYPYYTIYDLDDSAPYVLNYTSKEDLIFRPASGTTWITIDASLLWQNNQTVNNSELKIVDEDDDNYVTVPFEADVKVTSGSNETTYPSKRYPMDEKKVYISYSSAANNSSQTTRHLRQSDNSHYGDGFKMWKMQVNIGDYWWNGSSWEYYSSSNPDSAPSFILSFNNGASGSEDECIMTMKWMDLVPNDTSNPNGYTQQTGKSKYAIPIESNSSVTHGKLRVFVYPPRFIATDWETEWHSYTSVSKNSETRYGWKDFGPAIYCKDFEIAIEYTNNDLWWDDKTDTGKDIVYSNVIDTNYCLDADDIELKINTAIPDKPISRSFISDGDAYISGLKHYYGDSAKEQEKNLIDMYYEHYYKPCKIYTFNTVNRVTPFRRITLGSTLSGTFIIDAQNYDLKKCNNQITLIEYTSDLS